MDLKSHEWTQDGEDEVSGKEAERRGEREGQEEERLRVLSKLGKWST